MKCVCYLCELLLHTNNLPCEQSHLPLLQGEELAPGGDGQPSVAIKSMWDSVVSWMKMAVDFIAADNPPEADPVDTPSLITKGKVCDTIRCTCVYNICVVDLLQPYS